ncbi:4'-phosphopantetheinyl transferase family protein [Micromonospora sp. KLBMP9576]|uniref:4'-phosphopantetheinyl transferase family protein n=1 Tax=Micromonospora sp. KLBMP9576 TaxID=3424769 RepID=UPI003D9315F9
MSRSPVSGRDTAYVWIGRGDGGRPVPAGRLLRRAGATLLGWPEAQIVVGRGRDGGPRVAVRGAGGRLRLPVSVSRCGPVLAVAARPAGPVGIDVERCRPLPALALARRWYADAEAAWLAGRPADGQVLDFLRLWTAKEAVGKALGVGLRAGGLRRRMPVPVGTDWSPPHPAPGGVPVALWPVPALARLRVGHPRVGDGLVLAVAVDAARVEVVVRVEVVPDVGAAMPGGGHVAAVRSASAERTSLPVVVRGS